MNLQIELNGNDDVIFKTRSGLPVAKGYERIVIGDRGPYIEFDVKNFIYDSYFVPDQEKYRLQRNYLNKVFYVEIRTKKDYVKIYRQLKLVNYADYKIGKYYISPYDLYIDDGVCAIPKKINKEWLDNNLNYIFVFGDNILRKGTGGAAKLRNIINTYGFITKKEPNNKVSSFYTLEEYNKIFFEELEKLEQNIIEFPNLYFLISKLGNGLANKFDIYENIIEPELINISKKYNNVILLN